MRVTGKKLYRTRNVKTAAVERIRYAFENFDKISVSFSGGKDSTACLYLTLDEARRRNQLPLRLIFFDEEAIHPPTVEYVERVRHWPEVSLEWYCLPVRHRNACSNEQPFWKTWDPTEKHLWVRDLPEGAITAHPKFRLGMTIPEFAPYLLDRNECCISGIRTQESMRRYRLITSKVNDHFIARKGGKAYAYPIYDWDSADVWRLVKEEGYDYNQTYDILNRTRLFEDLLKQRVCPPFGEEPIQGLWKYAECWPDLWHKMLYRVKGVATAWRYAPTELYKGSVKPEGMTWREFCELQLSNYTEPDLQRTVRAQVAKAIAAHFNKTDEPIDDNKDHILTGVSWRFLARMAIKGDLKGRQLQRLVTNAQVALSRTGMSLKEAIEKHGTERYKARKRKAALAAH